MNADPLGKLHEQVRAALARASAAEQMAANDDRDGDALLNAARVDAFDWVLQRIDELREAARHDGEFAACRQRTDAEHAALTNR